MKTIDLNCDLGEGFPHDAELMPLITSANIAGGGHAGDDSTIRATVELAQRHGVRIGAHPGFEDRENFGRKEIAVSADELRALILRQIDRVANVAPLRHVKLHGALYNLAARDRVVAEIVARTIAEYDRNLVVFALAGGEQVRAGEAAGLKVAQEVFADRTYQPNGSLTPRSTKGALIESETEMMAQVLEMVGEGAVRALDGTRVKIRADTLCLHGDGAKSVSFAEVIRSTLSRHALQIRAFV